MKIFKKEEPKKEEPKKPVVAPASFFQIIVTCRNCGNEMPGHFEKGKAIDWKAHKQVCGRCGFDGGWSLGE